MATTVCTFSKNFPGEHAPEPPRAFFILNMLQNNSAGKNYTSKYVTIWCPLPEKISEYAADMKTFFKGLFTPFWGLTSLHLVYIQPNSNFTHPHQTFLDPLLSAGSSFF